MARTFAEVVINGCDRDYISRKCDAPSETDGTFTALYLAAMCRTSHEGRSTSQLARVGKCKRAHPPRILVENQCARDWRLRALAAILALAEPAVDADRRALGLVEIHAGGIDQL